LVSQELLNEFFAGIFLFILFVFVVGKKHPGFDMKQSGRQDQVFPRQVEIQRFHELDVLKILFRNLGDGYVVDIKLIFPDQVKEEIERAFEDG